MDIPRELRAGEGRSRTDRARLFPASEDAGSTVSVVLGDEHRLFIEALTSALSRYRIRVVGVGCSIPELVDAARTHNPDVCLLSQEFGAARGQDGVAGVREASPSTKVVVLTTDPAGKSIAGALRAGACGCVHKTRGIDHLVRAIHDALAGQIVIDAPQPPAASGDDGGEFVRKLAAQLTHRERQCLALLVEGLSTAGMAKRLGVSTATVRTHVNAVLTKMCVHSRLAAVSRAVRYGLLNPPSIWPEGPADPPDRQTGGDVV